MRLGGFFYFVFRLYKIRIQIEIPKNWHVDRMIAIFFFSSNCTKKSNARARPRCFLEPSQHGRHAQGRPGRTCWYHSISVSNELFHWWWVPVGLKAGLPEIHPQNHCIVLVPFPCCWCRGFEMILAWYKSNTCTYTHRPVFINTLFLFLLTFVVRKQILFLG